MNVRCCIAGGGPAGMMLGFLLARAGVDVVVLEKHEDFLRDFRGDTVHPSTLEVIAELGLLDDFLARPHQEFTGLSGVISGTTVKIADFRHLPTRCKFIVLMPQWEFLNFLAEHGHRYPAFKVLMRAEITDLIEVGGAIAGVRATTPDGPLEIRADLVVGADGRHSLVRERAGLQIDDFGAPIDVLWMRLSKRPEDGGGVLGRFDAGRILVMLDRGDYWQCAYVIPKGGFETLRARGLQALRDDIAAVSPPLRDRIDEIRDWDDVKLLTVRVDRLREWYRPGLLCIGDAAHAMSPIGGVGINLAIQDAVATANLLAEPLRAGTPTVRDLATVQRRRTLPTRLTQMMQVFIQQRIIGAVLRSTAPIGLPWPVKVFRRFPYLQRIPARVIGVGFCPEHVRAPEAVTPRAS
ncbi:MAG TPA: FAD-dependent oxidoreductase [Candidatus Elarobacter sp.]|jgi:2-polyprenyl-6-methoxyphenol hydroxylase-like FAD-dependent oxidoreductase|nr:FAD-dependent oxidoreductase [Candidatus Elarobacter sp.]